MVTIRIDIREGLIFGARSTVTVTRPTLAGALAAVTICLIGRTSLTLAEVVSALRSEHAAPATSGGDRGPVGDPFGLARPPVYQRHRGPFEVAAEALTKMLRPIVGSDVTVQLDDSPLKPLKPSVAERLADRPKPPGGA
jgi:hypothetical protein